MKNLILAFGLFFIFTTAQAVEYYPFHVKFNFSSDSIVDYSRVNIQYSIYGDDHEFSTRYQQLVDYPNNTRSVSQELERIIKEAMAVQYDAIAKNQMITIDFSPLESSPVTLSQSEKDELTKKIRAFEDNAREKIQKMISMNNSHYNDIMKMAVTLKFNGSKTVASLKAARDRFFEEIFTKDPDLYNYHHWVHFPIDADDFIKIKRGKPQLKSKLSEEKIMGIINQVIRHEEDNRRAEQYLDQLKSLTGNDIVKVGSDQLNQVVFVVQDEEGKFGDIQTIIIQGNTGNKAGKF